MGLITIYCGNWKFIPQLVKETAVILSQTHQTGEELSIKGQEILSRFDDTNSYDRTYFTNNENIVNGIRLAVKQIGLKAAEAVSFIFYDKAGISHRVKLDAYGNFGYGVPPRGFFDQIETDLLKLF